MQDIKKTHQVRKSIINLVSGCDRTGSCLNLHLHETSPSFTGSVRSTLEAQGISTHYCGFVVKFMLIACPALVALNIELTVTMMLFEIAAVFSAFLIHTVEGQVQN